MLMSELSVYETFRKTSARFPTEPFLYTTSGVAEHYKIEPGEVSYGAALDQVERLRECYRATGYGVGHRIGLMLDNRPSFIMHWFALNALGVSVVPINAELSAVEQAYLLEASEVCLLVHADEHTATARAAVSQLVREIPILDPGAINSVCRASSAARKVSIDSSSECAILFTSGSTGQPKGCLLSNEYFLEMGRWYCDVGGLCALGDGVERLITPLPLTHMNAMGTSLMAMVMCGGCLIQLDRFHPRIWWQTVHESRATVIHYLGVMPAILLQLDAGEFERNTEIKFGFGAGVNPAHHALFEKRFGFPLTEAWAMTETGSGGCIIAHQEPRHVGQSCFGKPDPERLEYRLVDESGVDVGPRDAGELLVRAAGNNPKKGYFGGYHRNDAATKEGWADGWWHTGDVVRALADGSLCFVDRRKNIIRRSGENIAALEVEAVLSQHPAINVLAVTSVLDEIRGDEVMACIVLNSGYAPNKETAKSIFNQCLDGLAYFKAPGYVAFVSALPLTATQKPKRNEIKMLAKIYLKEAPHDTVVFDLRKRKRKTLV